jgi:hypothetical protein
MMNKNMQLSPSRLGVSLGIVWGVGILLVGVMAMIRPGSMEAMIELLSLYPGFEASVSGIFIGFFWGFIDGFIGAFVVAWLYNWFGLSACGTCGKRGCFDKACEAKKCEGHNCHDMKHCGSCGSCHDGQCNKEMSDDDNS